MMINENIETRVGYKTISILTDMLKEYIDSHIINHIYQGEIKYLNLYKEFSEYLK